MILRVADRQLDCLVRCYTTLKFANALRGNLFDIPNTGTFSGIKRLKIVLVLEDKGHYKIDDDRAAECKEGKIDKVHAHRSGVYAELLAPPFANPKRAVFEPPADAVNHKVKLIKTGA
jgi:hypothetical protein